MPSDSNREAVRSYLRDIVTQLVEITGWTEPMKDVARMGAALPVAPDDAELVLYQRVLKDIRETTHSSLTVNEMARVALKFGAHAQDRAEPREQARNFLRFILTELDQMTWWTEPMKGIARVGAALPVPSDDFELGVYHTSLDEIAQTPSPIVVCAKARQALTVGQLTERAGMGE